MARYKPVHISSKGTNRLPMVTLLLLFAMVLVNCSSESSTEPSQPENPEEAETLLVDSLFFTNKLHSSRIKIAFCDDNTYELNYLEINGNEVNTEIIPTSGKPYHPQFSPDGSKLAFSTGAEGKPGESDLFVIDLSSEKRPITKLEAANAEIPRWRIADNGDTVIVYNDYAANNQHPLWSTSKTFQVSYSKNQFGTPQEIFGRSYNGGISHDNSFAVTGAPRLLFHYKKDDDSVNIDMYNQEQVCNVSISRDSSDIVSFLEARGSKGIEFTKDNSYYWHQYIFYMDSNGNILKAIKAQEPYVFDGTEWLFIPGIQISTMTSVITGKNEIIAIVDYENEVYHEILKIPGKEIIHPDLWADPDKQN